MNRNYGFLLAGSAMFGLGFGIYEFALPYFLDAHGISMGRMGIIYSAAALLTFALWVYTGDLSDRVGRKALYVASLVTTSVASGLTPLAPIFAAQIALKSIREAGGKVFDSMYQLALHDEGQSRYVDRVGKARGLQALATAGGAFVAGWLLLQQAYRSSFAASALVLLVAAVVFVLGYRQPDNKSSKRERSRPLLARMLPLNLPRPLIILTISAFIFMVGLATSHCFVMQLFWQRKFGASTAVVGTILMVHAISIGLPLLFVGWVVKRNLKQIYIVFVILEGIAVVVGGLVPDLTVAAIIWLAHDLFGAGVWIPIQSRLIQKYSHPSTRGRDVTRVFATASLGWVVGPLIAGSVFEGWYGGPFVISGAVMILSALILFALPAGDDEQTS